MNFWPLLSAGVWPVAVLAGAVALVTIIALLRAPREHVSAVFASFTGGFGIHRRGGCAHDDPMRGSSRDEHPAGSESSESAEDDRNDPLKEGA